MSQDGTAKRPSKNPHYKTCEKHGKIIYVHECPYCKPKVSVNKMKGVQ